MRFLCDMGVSQRVVDWLRSNGHDATHLGDEGLQRLPDSGIFQKAVAEQRIVISFDLDFGEIVAACAGNLISVILFRLHNTRTDHVTHRLATVHLQSADDLKAGCIIVIEEARHRVRKLPIGS